MAEEKSTAQARGVKKTRKGQVVSNAMDKTVVVSIATKVKDPRYGKYVKQTKKFYAHDKDNACNVGDIVQIVETRPYSKSKRWRVESVITKNEN